MLEDYFEQDDGNLDMWFRDKKIRIYTVISAIPRSSEIFLRLCITGRFCLTRFFSGPKMRIRRGVSVHLKNSYTTTTREFSLATHCFVMRILNGKQILVANSLQIIWLAYTMSVAIYVSN